MTVVPMTAAHVADLARLEAICFSAPWSETALAEELDNPQAVFLVCQNDTGEVLGYVGMHRAADEGMIANVAVFPEARRSGVAQKLLTALERYGREQHLYRLSLEVRVSNEAAISLYTKAGYRLDGIRPGFYRRPTEDAAIYSYYF